MNQMVKLEKSEFQTTSVRLFPTLIFLRTIAVCLAGKPHSDQLFWSLVRPRGIRSKDWVFDPKLLVCFNLRPFVISYGERIKSSRGLRNVRAPRANQPGPLMRFKSGHLNCDSQSYQFSVLNII